MSNTGTALEAKQKTSVSEPLTAPLTTIPTQRSFEELRRHIFEERRPMFEERRPGSVRHNDPVRLHDVLEKEAKRMAQSLHDEAGQLLAAVHFKLDELSRGLPVRQRDSV